MINIIFLTRYHPNNSGLNLEWSLAIAIPIFEVHLPYWQLRSRRYLFIYFIWYYHIYYYKGQLLSSMKYFLTLCYSSLLGMWNLWMLGGTRKQRLHVDFSWWWSLYKGMWWQEKCLAHWLICRPTWKTRHDQIMWLCIAFIFMHIYSTHTYISKNWHVYHWLSYMYFYLRPLKTVG